jgi:hypothetical protein
MPLHGRRAGAVFSVTVQRPRPRTQKNGDETCTLLDILHVLETIPDIGNV